MGTNRSRRVRTRITTDGLTEDAILTLITGHNFFGSCRKEYGEPPAPFRDKAHKTEVWLSVKDDFLEQMKREAEEGAKGYWRWYGAYLPWGLCKESIHAYWDCEKNEPMPRPEPKKLNELNGGK